MAFEIPDKQLEGRCNRLERVWRLDSLSSRVVRADTFKERYCVKG